MRERQREKAREREIKREKMKEKKCLIEEIIVATVNILQKCKKCCKSLPVIMHSFNRHPAARQQRIRTDGSRGGERNRLA